MQNLEPPKTNAGPKPYILNSCLWRPRKLQNTSPNITPLIHSKHTPECNNSNLSNHPKDSTVELDKNEVRNLKANSHGFQCQKKWGFNNLCFRDCRKIPQDQQQQLQRLNSKELCSQIPKHQHSKCLPIRLGKAQTCIEQRYCKECSSLMVIPMMLLKFVCEISL